MIHERKDGAAFVTVNRPGARNAFRDVATRDTVEAANVAGGGREPMPFRRKDRPVSAPGRSGGPVAAFLNYPNLSI